MERLVKQVHSSRSTQPDFRWIKREHLSETKRWATAVCKKLPPTCRIPFCQSCCVYFRAVTLFPLNDSLGMELPHIPGPVAIRQTPGGPSNGGGTAILR